jgi:hypothetical protein
MGEYLASEQHSQASGEKLHLNPAISQSYLNIEDISTERI